ncbi:hypothetical protein [Halobellus rufus]|uniref:hypothetical protein n=1 Tax=Halobellus rufus TaxID=1448860 RepID=UPI0006798D92|nr:hypothetical protein [Halobellus rufus]
MSAAPAGDATENIVQAFDEAEPSRPQGLAPLAILGGRPLFCEPATIARAQLFGYEISTEWLSADRSDLVSLREVR